MHVCTLQTTLREMPYDAFFWETCPFSKETQSTPFEFVVTAAAGFGGTDPDPGPFEEHLASGRGTPQVKVFTNLGG
jgi:hypothetical protein